MNRNNRTRYILFLTIWIQTFLVVAQVEPFHLYNRDNTLSMPSAEVIIQHTESKEGALRFAHPFFVNMTPQNSGNWTELADGCRIWTLAIHSEGAQSINLIFDHFKIDPNSRLIVYSPYHEYPKLTYSSEDETPSGVLPTVPIAGDLLVVEYQQYTGCKQTPEITIGAVNHDYLGIFGYLSNNKVGQFGDAGACNPNITCAADTNIVSTGKAVCKIIVDGTELCSGTLLNNTARDGTPYFLSAAHCFRRDESPFSTIFFFNYEVPSCQNNIEGTKMQYITGGTMKAFVDTLDMALLQMNQMPGQHFQPYWAGWSINAATSAPLYAIHHPVGDVKKYAITTDPLTATTFSSYTNSGKPFASDAHWLVRTWTTGTTQGGSSGCGIFDANNRLVGSLSGGEATCSNPRNDYFMRLNRGWNAGSMTNQQLAHWLNPDNQSIQELDGMDYYQYRMERFSYISSKSTPSAQRHSGNGNGFVAGHNAYQHKAFAQYFDNISQAKIKGVFLVSGKTVNYSDQTFTIHLWDDNNGAPGEIIASINNIPISTLKINAETFYEFPNAIEVKRPFHIGAEITYQQTGTDSVALFVSKGLTGIDKNRLFIHDGSQWQAYSDLVSKNEPASLWIDILATEMIISDIPDTAIKEELFLYPQKVSNGFTVAIDNDTISELKIYDMNGKTLISEKINAQSTFINCPHLPSGIYIVRVQLSKSTVERKILKLSN